MEEIAGKIPGVRIFSPKRFLDNRGFFAETFPYEFSKTYHLPTFVQDNFAVSKKDVLRGMHFQEVHPQAKLIWVSYGEILDVLVDLRERSPTYLQYEMVPLSLTESRLLYVPEGFAHGYLVTSPFACVHYKVSSPYRPNSEKGFIYNDPLVEIPWPCASPILSKKDAKAPSVTKALRSLKKGEACTR